VACHGPLHESDPRRAVRNEPLLPKPPAGSLPPLGGEVIGVATAEELLAAVDRLSRGGTILLFENYSATPKRPIRTGISTIFINLHQAGDAGRASDTS
jgi:hypothetical protein